MVNERGEIMAQLPQFESAVLRAEFAVMLGTTPYAYLGNWPVLGVVLIMLLVVFGRPSGGRRLRRINGQLLVLDWGQ